MRASVAHNDGEFAEARDLYRRLLAGCAGQAGAVGYRSEPHYLLLGLGRAEAKLGDVAAARAAFEKSIAEGRLSNGREDHFVTWPAREELHRLLRGTPAHPSPCCLSPFGETWEYRQRLTERAEALRRLEPPPSGVPDAAHEAALVEKAQVHRKLADIEGRTAYDHGCAGRASRYASTHIVAELVMRHRLAAPGQVSARLAVLLVEQGRSLLSEEPQRAADELYEAVAMLESTGLEASKHHIAALAAALEAALRLGDRTRAEPLVPRLTAEVPADAPADIRGHLADCRTRLALLPGGTSPPSAADAEDAARLLAPLLPVGHPRLDGLYRRAGDACLAEGRAVDAAGWYRRELALWDYPGSVQDQKRAEAQARLNAALNAEDRP